ncbi:MAG: SDR family NAD(P)-dependent oxidoreductase [Chloroflexi bacterium]|nr:SDR family NAD(P)-dependent oxidoreductase [Chloroflexota bacterium]
MTDSAERAIAVVGVGAILPDAMGAPAFWNNIVGKRYSISETPPERWSIADYYDPDPTAPDKSYTRIGGWVRGFTFDWKRFKIPPRVAAAMDEGQQWAVTIAAEALADYGFPDRPLDTDRTGVILGTAMGGELHYITHQRVVFPEYLRLIESTDAWRRLPKDVQDALAAEWHAALDRRLPPVTEDTMPGELPNIVSGRVANVLNLRGPNFITDAACASTLAAIDAACEQLIQHQCDAVVTGGVDRNMGASTFVKFCKIGALSATGTRPFGDGADGFVMGEGSASFLLKRLADAERDGDRIYAVIRGVGASSDGKGKGITAPNPLGQVLAVERAWQDAGLDPSTATLVEAHGTSTRVGDVVEVESLATCFRGERGSIGLGSAKSNIGHLKAGAGAAGMLKAVMAIHHKILPPTLNCEKPNPNIDFNATPFYLLHEAREWERRGSTPRRAGVSAYGFGGTNFHIVLEEYVPGMLRTEPKVYASAAIAASVPTPPPASATAVTPQSVPTSAAPARRTMKKPLRGILAIGAPTPVALKEKLDAIFHKVEDGWTPPVAPPDPNELRQPQRLVIDFGDRDELIDRLKKAQKAAGFDNPAAWKALQAQGVFRGSGPKPGKLAFLFPGQGSQYTNMGRELLSEPAFAEVIKEGDVVMTPILGRPLTSYIYIDSADPDAVKKAERDLMQTAITQPAMLMLDAALYRLLGEYGFAPDMVMGHSLGEYAALNAAGIMPFAEALEASAARGSEMSKVRVDDNGWMAAVMAPLDVVLETLKEVDGYIVPANINSYNQAVVGGASKAVEQAIELFTKKGFQAQRIPVSHAFHTRIVAPASGPLRQQLDRFHIAPPRIPLVANVTGELYPTTVPEIKDILEKQIASPVQWVKGLETLYREGVRCFVEVGPKKALKGFVDDVLGTKPDVVSLFTNHPKTGTLQSFNHALCGLYAAGYGLEETGSDTGSPSGAERARSTVAAAATPVAVTATAPVSQIEEADMANGIPLEALGKLLAQALQGAGSLAAGASRDGSLTGAYDRNVPPSGSVVISGTGLGLPGAEKPLMDEQNALRILHGEQFIDLIPERFRRQMLARNITRVVKSEDGSGSFETLAEPNEVIRLAGRPGRFDLSDEYGVPAKLVEALDTTTQIAMAAGLDALREAGIPLVQTYRKTTTGKDLPDRWMLPEALRDETGVIFASAFPGLDRIADEFERYYTYENRREQIEQLEALRQITTDPATLAEIARRIGELRDVLEREPYAFDRRFIFRILAMGHSQFAEYIGARGPNTHVNAACAATTQAIAIAEDWIRTGRCRRVLVIAGDNITSDRLLAWMGAGFLATGAAATDDRVEEAALPFDRRRHGMLLGMGACALVVESEDAVRERGMRGIVEVLSSETANSAFHGTRLDVAHISGVMNSLMTAAERRFGIDRRTIAPHLVFVSHETFTPARGGSASAEVVALRSTFGEAASQIIVSNTKGFTGHPMGVGIEDVIAVKILEHGIVPPVPNYKEVDPDLGQLNLSRGGRYPVQYALHLAAGFGSQIAMTLTRRIPGAADRVDNRARYDHWIDQVSGYDHAETEVVKRVLRVRAQGAPTRRPAPGTWQPGTGPMLRAIAPGDGTVIAPAPVHYAPAPRPTALPPAPPAPSPAPSNGKPVAEPAPAPVATTPVAPPVAPAPAAPAPVPVAVTPSPTVAAPVTPVVVAPAAPAMDTVTARVLEIVAEKTGYPPEMLDLDLDLEADLGVDTVKQAETFVAVREAFAIPQVENLRLRDFPTLRDVVGFVYTQKPELKPATTATAPPPAPVATPAAPVAPAPVAPVSPAPIADVVTARVLEVVAEKTGYPSEMLDLDLDLEADLGVDTVKQAETFAAIREAFAIERVENLKLRDYPTLRHVIGFVYDHKPELRPVAAPPQAAPVAPAMPTPAPVTAPATPVAPAPVADVVTARVLEVVAEKTGYPPEMLDLDLDLEADLGVDTVKQAETFAAIREAFAIERIENLKLRDYPTLRHVIGFVYDHKPELRPVAAPPQAVPAAPVAPAPVPVAAPAATVSPAAVQPAAPAPAPAGDIVTTRVLEVVAEKTGYPPEMLELDLDLEADLGVDTVKQAETFAAIREAFAIERVEDLKLRDYPTLRHVINFVYDHKPELRPVTAPPQAVPVAPVAPAPAPVAAPAPAAPAIADVPATDVVTTRVLEVVAEKTGYPPEMLELDLDLEADLGVDTVKQAETFAAIREAFAIERVEDLKLRDYPTLRHVINFVYAHRPELKPAAGATIAPQPAAPAMPAAPAPVSAGQPAVTLAPVENADMVPRRVVVPALRPAIDLCKPTGVTLDSNTRVVVMMDRGGIGKALLNRLEKRGVGTLVLEEPPAAEELEQRLKGWMAEGPIHGVYWLPALDIEPAIEDMDLDTWRELNRVRAKNLYLTLRTLYETLVGPGTFLVSATRMGGLHGYGPDGASAPLGGAVVGATKSYKRERLDILVKAVDFEPGRKTAEPADALIAETLFDPGAVEIGYHNGLRYTVTFEELPAADGTPGMQLGKDTVFVVTGAAGGITSAITADLAAASGGIFYLLDLTPTPDPNDPNIALFRQDKEALKRKLIEDFRAAGERPTPVMIDRKILGIEREEAALRAIEAVQATGGTAHYFSVNLLDGPAVAAVIADVRERYGRIDVLLHAGGIEISRALPDKEPKEFNLVFDIKADGFFSILNAAKGMPIGATVAFSSVAGRFGNSGQSDYSSANDLLCKVSSSMRTWRPATRGIAIDWTAWGGIGMATRGSIPKIMEMAGIDMLPPEAGIPTIRRELTKSTFRGEIVVGQRLGILAAEFDETGGLDPAKVGTEGRLMIGAVKAFKLHGGIQVETTFDPKEQPFLYDHQIDGVPVLPGVMGTEAFAELATLLAPGYHVASLTEQFSTPFKFHRNQPRTLYLSATIHPAGDGQLLAKAMLRAMVQPRPELPPRFDTHFVGEVHLTNAPLEAPKIDFVPPSIEALDIDRERIYRVYFHGPAYQVMERIGVIGDRAVALMADNLPANSVPDAPMLAAPRLIELCFQAAGMWEMVTQKAMALPESVGSVTVYRQPESAQGRRLYAVVTSVEHGASYDVQVVDTDGNVYVDLHGYRTVRLPGEVSV